MEIEDKEKWVDDSSVDHKGNVPLRSSTGAWKASFYIIAIEFSERLSYFGIATSLIIYLTKVLHQDLKTAAKSVNYWSGVTTLMPLLGGFLADSYLGRFSTVLASTIIYLMGLILLTMSWFVPSLKPCDVDPCKEPRRIHEVMFFLAIYLVSVGTGGHKPSLESFGADQFDDDNPRERKQKMSFFNWWNFGLCSGLVLGVTVIVYVQAHVNWGVADIALTSVMAVSLLIFIAGRRVYRYRKPGSPLTPLLQVVVAAIRKRSLAHPAYPATQLYQVTNKSDDVKGRGRLLCHTKKLKFLDKAAIVEETSGGNENPWRLSTVTRVEELKLLLNMIPIWVATLPFGVCIAQSSTFFIKQAAAMNRHISSFEVPPASVFAVAAGGMIVSVTLYEKVLVPALRRATGNERGLNILPRIGVGMCFSVATMLVAAFVERRRLSGAATSALWLVPQFFIVGFGDGFALVGLQEYFYDQVPDSMRSLGIAFYLSVIGAANFISSWLITVVDDITGSGGGRSWFGPDLNSSRLDKFYLLLAVATTVNLVFYVWLARRYSYKNVQKVAVADCYVDGGGGGGENARSII